MDDELRVKLFLKGISFAAEKHKLQKRKATGESFITHPIGVAEILYDEGFVTNIEVIVAALLHDTVEDTDATLDDIEKEFGSNIAKYVEQCSDDKSLSQVERKKLQIVKAPTKCPEAKLIKIADKLHNMRDLKKLPPPTWSDKRVQGYFVWSYKVCENLRGINYHLDVSLDDFFKSVGIIDGVTNEQLEEYYEELLR